MTSMGRATHSLPPETAQSHRVARASSLRCPPRLVIHPQKVDGRNPSSPFQAIFASRLGKTIRKPPSSLSGARKTSISIERFFVAMDGRYTKKAGEQEFSGECLNDPKKGMWCVSSRFLLVLSLDIVGEQRRIEQTQGTGTTRTTVSNSPRICCHSFFTDSFTENAVLIGGTLRASLDALKPTGGSQSTPSFRPSFIRSTLNLNPSSPMVSGRGDTISN